MIKFQTGRKKAAEVYQAMYSKYRVAGALTDYGDAAFASTVDECVSGD